MIQTTQVLSMEDKSDDQARREGKTVLRTGFADRKRREEESVLSCADGREMVWPTVATSPILFEMSCYIKVLKYSSSCRIRHRRNDAKPLDQRLKAEPDT